MDLALEKISLNSWYLTGRFFWISSWISWRSLDELALAFCWRIWSISYRLILPIIMSIFWKIWNFLTLIKAMVSPEGGSWGLLSLALISWSLRDIGCLGVGVLIRILVGVVYFLWFLKAWSFFWAFLSNFVCLAFISLWYWRSVIKLKIIVIILNLGLVPLSLGYISLCLWQSGLILWYTSHLLSRIISYWLIFNFNKGH